MIYIIISMVSFFIILIFQLLILYKNKKLTALKVLISIIISAILSVLIFLLLVVIFLGSNLSI